MQLLKPISAYQPPRTAQSRGSRCHQLNEHYFDALTPESAYWLGYLGADGCISVRKTGPNYRQFIVSLASKDYEQLEAFRDALETTYPIHGPYRGCWSLTMTSYHMCKILERRGLTQRKSLTMAFPSAPRALEIYVMRGLVDGDGYLGEVYRKSRAVKHNGYGRPPGVGNFYTQIGVAGSLPVCTRFWRRFDGSVHPHAAVHRWYLCGAKAEQAIQAIYADNTVSALARKKLVASQLLAGR
jgi:hypothetical protein